MAVTFKSRDDAHAYYAKYIVEAQEKLGASVVNNDTWYIGTHLKDADFEKGLDEVMSKIGLTPLAYSIEKTQVGQYWFKV